MLAFTGFDLSANRAHGLRFTVGGDKAPTFRGLDKLEFEPAVRFATGSTATLVEKPAGDKGTRRFAVPALIPLSYFGGRLYQAMVERGTCGRVMSATPEAVRSIVAAWESGPQGGKGVKADEHIEAWLRNEFLVHVLGLARADAMELLKAGQALGNKDKRDAALCAIAAWLKWQELEGQR